jgi:Xaa-Pro aminopeptidase
MFRNHCDAILVLGMVNIRYLCGFTGSDGALIVTLTRTYFLTDSRYTSQAKQQVSVDETIEYSNKVDAIKKCLYDVVENRVDVAIGFEANEVTVGNYNQLKKKCPDFSWSPVDEYFVALRQIKDEAEIACLDRAAQLNSQAMELMQPKLTDGVSEVEFALELEYTLRKLGGEDKAFDFIVASGYRGAMPHGVASEKIMGSGELVTIDFGTRNNGYYSDETVTFGIGSVPAQLREIYDVVLQAHDLALNHLAVAMPAREIDYIARQFIKENGYGEFFGHGLGHGVGLEVHESPTISPRSEALLEAGMVFTIEPGIYLPGIGGVRIEDTVVMMQEGYRCLTRIPKYYQSVE